MDEKTRDRIYRRQIHGYEEAHVWDTSIIVAILKSMSAGRSDPALKYLAKVKDGKYRVYVTPIVYGEAFFVVFRDSEPGMRGIALERLAELFSTENAFPFFPEDLSALSGYFSEVLDVEKRCGTTDARIVAEALAVQDLLKEDPATCRLKCRLISAEKTQCTKRLETRTAEELD